VEESNPLLAAYFARIGSGAGRGEFGFSATADKGKVLAVAWSRKPRKKREA
jgi:hypothetical protein